jgi:hypothetical protein
MILYLTPAEQKLFEKLPASVRDLAGLQVHVEDGDAFETDEQLEERIGFVQKNSEEELRGFLVSLKQKLQENADIDAWFADAVPEALFPSICYALGAVGLTSVITRALQFDPTTEGLKSAAVFSRIRHVILEQNSHSAHV